LARDHGLFSFSHKSDIDEKVFDIDCASW
jgi:hypothetical protein